MPALVVYKNGTEVRVCKFELKVAGGCVRAAACQFEHATDANERAGWVEQSRRIFSAAAAGAAMALDGDLGQETGGGRPAPADAVAALEDTLQAVQRELDALKAKVH